MPNPYTQQLEFLKRLAHQAGDIMRRYYGRSFKVYEKPDKSKVTEVDLAISEVVHAETPKVFPDVGLYTEEAHNKTIEPGKSYFIIDELDGTSYFIENRPGFSHQAAYYDAATGDLAVGLVYYPLDDVLLYAVRGQGAFIQNDGSQQLIEARPYKPIRELRYAHPARYRGDKYWNLFERLNIREGQVLMTTARRTLQFATGRLDVAIFLQKRIPEWDLSGEQVIVEELGMHHSYLDGSPVRFGEPPPPGNSGYLICPPDHRDYFLNELKKFYL